MKTAPKRPITGFLLVFIALVSVVGFQAQMLGAGNVSDALWVGTSQGLLKLDPASGALLLRLTDVTNVQAVAVDEKTGDVWAYADKKLRSYDSQGAFLAGTNVPGGLGQLDLAVNPNDGTVWLGLGVRLFHFSPLAQLSATIPLKTPVLGLSLFKTESVLWVATQKSLAAYDMTGKQLVTFVLSDIRDIAVDDESGDIWVGLKNLLARFDDAGVKQFELPLAACRT